MKVLYILLLIGVTFSLKAQVSQKENHTLKVISNQGTFYYEINNTGDVDVSKELQNVFNEIASLKDASATFIFSPGIYYLNAPVNVKLPGVKMIGHGHGGIDIHGANIVSGTIFYFGENTGAHCITFNYAGRDQSFPAKESPWSPQNLKVEIENISFVGYNNTGVNTAEGYCRWRKDKPLFKSLNWFPSKERYKDAEKEGQRAIYLPPPPKIEGWAWAKCELLRISGCHFTDLYVGIDAPWTDVSYINNNWFGQLTYAIRLSGPGMMITNNLFADLETALKVKRTTFSVFSNNTFAYVSKCFEFNKIENSNISNNALVNKRSHTGSAAFGSFIYAQKSNNLNVIGNSVNHEQDSRKRTVTVDTVPNGQSFIQFDNSNNLNFSNNIINTFSTQTVVRLHNATNCVITNNIIRYNEGGNAIAETGDSNGNYYKKIDVTKSDAFDTYKY